MTLRRLNAGGQALVEFALVFILFAWLLFGIIDFGRYVYTMNALGNAAREATRYGSVGNRPPECNGLTRADCVIAIGKSHAWGLGASTVTVTPTCTLATAGDPPPPVSCASAKANDFLRVQTKSTLGLVTPLVAQFFGNLTITAESVATINQ